MRVVGLAEEMGKRAKVVTARARKQLLFSRTTKQSVIGSADRSQSGGLVLVFTTSTDSADDDR
jgi:hypothetical protein